MIYPIFTFPLLAVLTASLSLLSHLDSFAADSLFQTLMTEKEREETGVSRLTNLQQTTLESWIKTHFTPKTISSAEGPLTLSLNVGEGTFLQLSDGTSYEVAPDDRFYATYWVTPFLVTLSPSNDPAYPLKLTNLNTGTAVRVKKISNEEFLHPSSPQASPNPSPSEPSTPKSPPPSSPSPKEIPSS